MKVSHSHDTATHAFIGKSEVQEMGIADSSALMQILSAALYSDPIKAVVREVMCNAWDAHIASGNEDIPIQINISDSLCLSIRDFGYGIPHDRMKEIYGTYGASTKSNDGTQTGGFGLGCKSPFAYVDTFQVINRNQKTMARYVMMKASDGLNGKPSMNMVGQSATEESGLTVEIRLEEKDERRFRELIQEIAIEGGILIEGNVATVTMDQALNAFKAELPFVFSTSLEGVFVRYGNVIYPVEEKPEYATAYEGVKHFIRHNLTNLVGIQGIVLMAPGSSISLTPSREHLTYTQRTLDTIGDLLKKSLNQFSNMKEAQKQPVIQYMNAKLIEQLDIRTEGFFKSIGFDGNHRNRLNPIEAVSEIVTMGLGQVNPGNDWIGYNQQELESIAKYLVFKSHRMSVEWHTKIMKSLPRFFKKHHIGSAKLFRKWVYQGIRRQHFSKYAAGVNSKMLYEFTADLRKGFQDLMDKYPDDVKVRSIREVTWNGIAQKSLLKSVMYQAAKNPQFFNSFGCQAGMRISVERMRGNARSSRYWGNEQFLIEVRVSSKHFDDIFKDIEKMSFSTVNAYDLRSERENYILQTERRKAKEKKLKEKELEIFGEEGRLRLKKSEFYHLDKNLLLNDVRKTLLSGSCTIANPKYFLIVNNSKVSPGLNEYSTFLGSDFVRIGDIPFIDETAFVTKAQHENGKTKDLIELTEFIKESLITGVELESSPAFNLIQMRLLIRDFLKIIDEGGSAFGIYASTKTDAWNQIKGSVPSGVLDTLNFGGSSLRQTIMYYSDIEGDGILRNIFSSKIDIELFSEKLSKAKLHSSFAVLIENFIQNLLPERLKQIIGEFSGYSAEFDQVIRLLIKTVNKEIA